MATQCDELSRGAQRPVTLSDDHRFVKAPAYVFTASFQFLFPLWCFILWLSVILGWYVMQWNMFDILGAILSASFSFVNWPRFIFLLFFVSFFWTKDYSKSRSYKRVVSGFGISDFIHLWTRHSGHVYEYRRSEKLFPSVKRCC